MEVSELVSLILDINKSFQLVPTDLFVLIVALSMLGYFLKRDDNYCDEYIPLFLLVFSCIASVLLVGLSVTSVLQGIVCWGISIGIHQTVKQYQKKNKK